MRLLLGKVQSLNYTERMDWHSTTPTTPTRIVMCHRSNLRIWVKLLKELNVNFEEFANQEATLIDDGWNADTVLVLLTDDYRCEEIRLRSYCRCCFMPLDDPRANWDPLWGQRKERIKKRLDLDGPFNEEELEVQAKWQRYIRLFRGKRKCYYCWEEHEKSGDNAGMESHPGLLEIEI